MTKLFESLPRGNQVDGLPRAPSKEHLQIESGEPRLRALSILHSDRAKTYRKIGPMQWPAASPLWAPETYTDPPFARHLYTSTLICHKRKVGTRQQYVRKFKLRLPNGRIKFVLGGTQKVDGYWASLRRFVGKRSVNTGDHPDAHRRETSRLKKLNATKKTN